MTASDLQVVEVRALRGPSLWARDPVLVAELRAGVLSRRDLDDASARVVQLLSLEGLENGSWGHVLLAVVLELQKRAGAPEQVGRVIIDDPANDRWALAIGFDEEDLAAEAVHEGVRIVRDCIRNDDIDLNETVAHLVRTYERARPGPTSLVMIEAARARGIPVRRNRDDGIIQLGLGAAMHRLRSTMTDFTSVIAAEITSNKQRTKDALARVGLDVPGGSTARTIEDALDIARDVGFPVLLKPLDANNGRGISGRIDDEEGVRAAWPAAVAEHPVVIVERFAEGKDHRVVVVNGRVVAAVERIPAHVRGDGVRSIRELAEAINLDPNRSKTNPSASLSPLPLDARTLEYLARSGRTLDSIPAADEVVTLRATANISTGGTAIDRTDDIHPENRALCELAAGAVALDVAGLDVLTPDISIPFRENNAVIIEVNASPGIRMHTHPDSGTPRDVPGAILDMLYPEGTPTSIPVIAITGTNGKTTTTRLIAHLFTAHAKRVGFTTTDGVYFREQLLMEGDLTGPFAANIILSHPQVDVAVLETARGGILRAGLGFTECDVAVVTNVSADHLGLRDINTIEQLAAVKAVVPSAVKPTGHAILNADDHRVAAMREQTQGRVVLFSTAPLGDNPLIGTLLAEGGVVACLEGEGAAEEFVIHDGETRIALGTVAEVPLTFGGMARFQLGNVLAAAAAAYVQGVPPAVIREGLSTFTPSASRTPGRMNVMETTRGRVIIDYAHNAAATAGLFEYVRKTPAKRRFAILGAPGDRRDEDLREIGRLSAGLDVLIFKEHEHYRRGRAVGEIARLMAEGAKAGGARAGSIFRFDDERDAVALALGMMRSGDVVVVMADDAAAVTRQLEPYVIEEKTGAASST
ncbi:MAG: cphA [Gemmatimonadetes bacterium]|nr:cphA [Gemmatimonadota bacterium]